MSSSPQQSFCTQCHKEKTSPNNIYIHDTFSCKVKDLNDAQTRFHKLQRQILLLKEENQHKINTIQALKHQLNEQKHRKSSVQIQIQQNKKSFENLKTTLLSFGNNQDIKPQITQPRPQSTNILIDSLQKRLKQYKIELLKLIEKVQLYQKSTEWMYQFIDSFLKMVLEINKTGRYGETLVLKELSIKKRTRIAWKYLKDVLEKVLNG